MSSPPPKHRCLDQLSGLQGFLYTGFQYLRSYSFYKDAKLLRLTRYRYNNVPYDNNGQYFYIKDGADVWNPAGSL